MFEDTIKASFEAEYVFYALKWVVKVQRRTMKKDTNVQKIITNATMSDSNYCWKILEKSCRKFDILMLNTMFNVSEWNLRTYKSEIFGLRNTQFADIYMFHQNENDTSSNFDNRISFGTTLIFPLHFICHNICYRLDYDL